MNQRLAFNLCLLLTGSFQDDSREETVEYTRIGDTALLSCNDTRVSNLIWRRKDHIISDGTSINPGVVDKRKYRISGDHITGEYNLEIVNTTTDDLGDYWCEALVEKKAIQRKVVLRLKETRTETVTQRSALTENKERTENRYNTDGSNNTTAKDNGSNGSYQHVSTHTEKYTVFPMTTENVVVEDKAKEKRSSTEFSSSERLLYYGLLGAGLLIVLTLSIVINVCITRKCKHASVQITGNLQTEPAETSQVLETSSQYESICESEMIRNHTEEPPVEAFIPHRSSSDKSYLEVVDDDVPINSYQPMPASGENNGTNIIHKYCKSTEVSGSKSITSPEYEVATNENPLANIQNRIQEITGHQTSASLECGNGEAAESLNLDSPDSVREGVLPDTSSIALNCQNRDHENNDSYEMLRSARFDDNDYTKLEQPASSYVNVSDYTTSVDGVDKNNEQESEGYMSPYQNLISNDARDSDTIHEYTKVEGRN